MIALLVGLVGLAIGLPHIMPTATTLAKNTIEHHMAEGTSVEESVKAALTEEHDEIIEAVRQDFDIPVDAWNQAMDEFRALRAADDLLLPESAQSYKKANDPLTNHIKELLAQECINPDKVSIAYISNKECPLLAMQEFNDDNQIEHRILIDKEWFLKRPADIQDAIIRHEMVHLKHYDSIEGGYMIDIVLEHGYTREEYEKSKAVRNYRHFREFRADMLAGVKHIDIAQALQKDLAQYKHNHAEDNHHHPSSSARCEKMATLITYLDAEKQQSSLA
jgi:hypothetical protein